MISHFTDGNPEAQSCAHSHMTNSWQRLGPKVKGGFHLLCHSPLQWNHEHDNEHIMSFLWSSFQCVLSWLFGTTVCQNCLGWALAQSRPGCGLSTAWLERSLGTCWWGAVGRQWSLVTRGCELSAAGPQGTGGARLGVEAMIWLWCWTVAGW